jgi:hypothetical protein
MGDGTVSTLEQVETFEVADLDDAIPCTFPSACAVEASWKLTMRCLQCGIQMVMRCQHHYDMMLKASEWGLFRHVKCGQLTDDAIVRAERL